MKRRSVAEDRHETHIATATNVAHAGCVGTGTS